MIISTMRPHPVLITVPAPVIALVALALRGGPLGEPMCYAQMGGMNLCDLPRGRITIHAI